MTARLRMHTREQSSRGDVQFPRDLGPHEDYQTEWWYYTGNWQTEDGRDFGYQFTIFRRALQPAVENNYLEDPSTGAETRFTWPISRSAILQATNSLRRKDSAVKG